MQRNSAYTLFSMIQAPRSNEYLTIPSTLQHEHGTQHTCTEE